MSGVRGPALIGAALTGAALTAAAQIAPEGARKALVPPLPGDLAEPLHLFAWLPSPFLLLLLAMFLAIGLIAWYFSRRGQPTAGGAPRLHSRRELGDPLASEVDALRQRHLAAGTFRQGCHELAELLRGHLESRGWYGIVRMTVAETVRAFGHGGVVSVLDRLTNLQFDRREPTEIEFVATCHRVVQAGRKSPKRQPPGKSTRPAPSTELGPEDGAGEGGQ